MCQDLGPKKHDEISEIDRTGTPQLTGFPERSLRGGGTEHPTKAARGAEVAARGLRGKSSLIWRAFWRSASMRPRIPELLNAASALERSPCFVGVGRAKQAAEREKGLWQRSLHRSGAVRGWRTEKERDSCDFHRTHLKVVTFPASPFSMIGKKALVRDFSGRARPSGCQRR